MRRLLLGLFFCINVLLSYAEVPQGISYQAVIRDAYGQLIPNSNIGIRVNILQGDKNGNSVYSEVRRISTNENGLLTFTIGEAASSSSIGDIDWSLGDYYIQCDFDLTGGDHYTLTLTSRVMSVPYALYAERISPQALPSWIDPDGKPAYSYEEIANTPRIPQRISELENDANYLTEHQSLEGYAKKADIPSLADYATKAELQNISSSSSSMIHDSLSNYAKTTDLPNMANYATKEDLPSLDGYAKTTDIPSLDGYAKTTDIPSLTDYAKKSDLPTIPTKVSELTNDANYLTEHQSLEDYAKKSDIPSLDDYATKAELQNVSSSSSSMIHDSLSNYAKTTDLPVVPTKVSELTNDANYLTAHQSLEEYAKKSDIPSLDGYAKTTDIPSLTDYAKKSDLPTIPTKVSELENDANYLTEHQSLEGYAKKSDIPSLDDYATKAELQNISSSSSEMIHDSLSNYAKTTDLPNMANYATKEDLPSLDGYAKTADIPSLEGYAKTTDIPSLTDYAKKSDLPAVPTKVSELENDVNYLTEHQSLEDYAKKSDIPSLTDYAKKSELPAVPTKVSELANDANYLTEHQSLEGYAKRSDLPTKDSLLSRSEAAETYQLKGAYLTEHQSLADYATKAELKSLSTAMIRDSLKLYVTKDEMITAIDNAKLSGDATSIDMSNYATKEYVDGNYAKTIDLPVTDTLLGKAEAAATYQPKGNYLTAHQSLKDYAKKSDIPTVPTNVSELTNDAGYITAADVPAVNVPTKVSAFENDVNYLTEHQSLADYAKKSDLPKADSLLSKAEAAEKYLTEHQSLNDYAKKSEIPAKVAQLEDATDYAKKTDVPTVPEKVSAFTNDAQYITQNDLMAILSDISAMKSQLAKLTSQNDSLKTTVDSLSSVIKEIQKAMIKRITTWEENFSNGIGNVANNSVGWYELSANDQRLSAILYEPDNSQQMATVIISAPHPVDLTEGAYLSMDVTSMTEGVVKFGTWNGYNSFSLRLKDASENYSDWMTIGGDGFAATNGFNSTVSVNKQDISGYLPNTFDRQNVVAIEFTLIGYAPNFSYKQRSKGVYIDNIRLSRNTYETVGSNSNGNQEIGGDSESSERDDDQEMTYKRTAVNSYSYSTSSWNYGPELYHNLKEGDRIIYVCRHSERDDNCSGHECDLNSNGIALATEVGKKYVGGPAAANSSYFYGSTDYPRCKNTSYLIATNRGDVELSSKDAVNSGTEIMNLIKGNYFTECTSWPDNAELYEKHTEAVDKLVLHMIDGLCGMTEGKTFSWFTSHDFVTVVLTEWATKNGNFYDVNSTWINYMSGIAVIVHPDKTWEAYPVRNLESGYLQKNYAGWGRCNDGVVVNTIE